MKPRLAIAYDLDSFSPIEIATAVGERCDLIWVIDGSESLGPMGPLLPRTGAVVDIAGCTPEESVAQVGDARPEGVVAFSDGRLSLAATIAAGLGLRHNPPEVTARFLDKYEQRVAFRDSGVAVPGFACVPADATAAQIVELTADLVFPAVMKPRRGSGSRDTHLVESADALVRLLAPGDGERVAAATEHVVEEYLHDAALADAGTVASYVSVESVVVNGCARHLAVTGKFPLAEPFRETGNFMPSRLSAGETESVTALADDAVAALGVEFGCLHTEIKLTPAGPRLIESNARVGGGGIEHLFVMSYGESLLRVAAMAALGIELPAEFRPESDEVVYQLFVQPPISASTLERADGLDDVSALPGVAQVFLNRRTGDGVDWRDGSQGYVLSVRGSVPDHDALRTLRDRILEQLDLAYT